MGTDLARHHPLWPSFCANGAIFVRENCPKALFKALEISGSEATAQGLGLQRDQSVPIVLAGNVSTYLDLLSRASSGEQGVLDGLRPFVGGAGQPDDVRKVLQGANGRTHDRATAGQV